MKKIIAGFVVFAFVLGIVSCKSGSSPSAVAQGFAKAMINQDFVTAKKYTLSANASLLDQMAEFSKSMVLPDSIKKIMDKAIIKTANEKITDTTATVDVTITLPQEVEGKKEQTQTLNLKKEKGVWKVDLGMPDMMPQDNAQSSQMPADSALSPLPTQPDSAEK